MLDHATPVHLDRPARPGHHRMPVLFVHGFAGTNHIWAPLRATLADSGFGTLIALRYNAFRTDIHQVADSLVDQAQQAMQRSGALGVHLVGHSMGGLVVRDAVQNRGPAGLAATAVTIATPHVGSRLAHLVPGPAARQMRPGSEFLTGLRNARLDPSTSWVTIHGAADRVVPLRSGAFDPGSGQCLTVRQAAAGHGSVARHPAVVSCIVRALLRSERLAAEAFSLVA
jgi:pimeloyl-ACP methyl ester carboxylesterase